MRIYTKSGDRCETGLMGGRRVKKYDLRIAAIGNLDELNAALGVLISLKPTKIATVILRQAQDDLFALGAEIADPEGKYATAIISIANVKKLEGVIDKLAAKLPRLKNFILPGGTKFAAHAHFARAICRRAERSTVNLTRRESVRPEILMYLNRLSDLLFMLARLDAFERRKKETIWKQHRGAVL